MSEQLRKACFVIPYFGKLPNTFSIYLNTCAANPDFDWLIITDDQTSYDYPMNVHYMYMTFDGFVHRVQSYFEFPISLKRPYKICDFRAAFGVIFAEELKQYRFWGHCDLDQYFGKINHFITDDILDSYDKILTLGHFTLFRNVPEINNMYLISDRKRKQGYKDAFTDDRHWIFDEWPTQNTSINHIMKQEKVKTFYWHDCFCDLVPFVSYFQRYIFDHNKENWKKDTIKNTLFTIRNGELYCYYRDQNGGISHKEMLYVHIRQRKMNCANYVPQNNIIFIFPNEIRTTNFLGEVEIKKLLRHTSLRSIFFPDEIKRKWVIVKGYMSAVKRRLLR